MLAPTTHMLHEIGGISIQDYAAAPNSMEPNSGVVRQIVMEHAPALSQRDAGLGAGARGAGHRA